MDRFVYDIWLAETVRASSYIEKLLQEYKSAEAVYKDKGRKCSFGRNNEVVHENLENISLSHAESIIEKCKDNNIEIIGREDLPDYLKNSPVCPLFMYAIGNKELLRKPLLTITGARRANFDGRENARKFAEILSAAGIGIVTGFADGIEETVINSVDEVISVLPCGILNPYPKEHYKLIDKIKTTGGLVLSSFEPNEQAYRWNFMARNKILAAISEGTLFIQAGQHSATAMIFKNCADYSRNCYAIPGAIDDKYYMSTNEFIKNGATLVTSPVDILEDYGIKYKEITLMSEEREEYSLSSVQRKITDAIKEAPLSCDKICQATGLDTGTVLTEILQLELMDVVARNDEDKIKLIIKE